MKILMIITCLLILIGNGYSQTTHPSKPLTQEDYLKKSKDQKEAGWILLGGGVAMFTIGSFIFIGKGALGATEGDLILPALGMGMAIASIPLFGSSKANKRRAATFSLQNQTLSIAPQIPSILNTQPTLSITIGL